jgi:putative SOS response-associated peptidase YedK
MCARLRLTYSQEKLANLLSAAAIHGELIRNENTAPTDEATIVAHTPEGFKARPAHFGLVPSWAKDITIAVKAFNARLETVEEKPMFRQAFAKRHCIIPCDGFYEWRTENGIKQPYFISRIDGELLILAGLWERWQDNYYSFSILTTEPNNFMKSYHNRMPVMLSNDSFHTWLQSGADKCSLSLLPDDGLQAIPVTRAVSNPKNKTIPI